MLRRIRPVGVRRRIRNASPIGRGRRALSRFFQLEINLFAEGYVDMTPEARVERDRMERDDLWKQLSLAISMRSSGDQITWTTLSIFFATNAVLLAALFRSGQYPNPWIGAIISALAFSLSVLWCLITMRILERLGMHERIIRIIQSELFLDSRPLWRQLAVCQKLTEAEDEHEIGRGARARVLIPWALRIVAALWLVGLGCFLYKARC